MLGGAALSELFAAADDTELRRGVAGCPAQLKVFGGAALSELLEAAEEKKLRSEVAGCSALLQLPGGSALSELLGAAAEGRFMALCGEKGLSCVVTSDQRSYKHCVQLGTLQVVYMLVASSGQHNIANVTRTMRPSPKSRPVPPVSLLVLGPLVLGPLA